MIQECHPIGCLLYFCMERYPLDESFLPIMLLIPKLLFKCFTIAFLNTIAFGKAFSKRNKMSTFACKGVNEMQYISYVIRMRWPWIKMLNFRGSSTLYWLEEQSQVSDFCFLLKLWSCFCLWHLISSTRSQRHQNSSLFKEIFVYESWRFISQKQPIKF